MEDELIQRARRYIELGDRYLGEGLPERAYESYLDALRTLGALLIYRDTGLLLPTNQLIDMLRSRYPEIYEIITRYERGNPENATALRRELEKLRGMMSLPSPDG